MRVTLRPDPKCPVLGCQATFADVDALNHHVLEVHDPEEIPDPTTGR